MRLPGKPPLWWTSSITKTREFLTKVTVVVFSIVTQVLGYLWWALRKYKSCHNMPNVQIQSSAKSLECLALGSMSTQSCAISQGIPIVSCVWWFKCLTWMMSKALLALPCTSWHVNIHSSNLRCAPNYLGTSACELRCCAHNSRHCCSTHPWTN